MKIDQSTQIASSELNRTGAAQKAKMEKMGRADSERSANVGESSSTEISSRAREMAQAKKIALSASDTRDEKIAELRRRIQNKEYNVRPDDIADRMVKEHLETQKS